MKTLKFEGYSDDTFSCVGPEIDVDHDNCANGKPIQMLVKGTGGQMLVVGQYCPGEADGWQISVAPWTDSVDDEPIPEWPMRITRSKRPYSPALIVEAPDDVTVNLLDEAE